MICRLLDLFVIFELITQLKLNLIDNIAIIKIQYNI